MATGTSVFLIALGAILAFAVDFTVAGLDIDTVGIVLMVAGVIGLAVTTLWVDRLSTSPDRTVDTTRSTSRTA